MTSIEVDNWKNDAACRGLVTEERNPWFDPGLEQEAKAVCFSCDVQEECLAFAFASQATEGVYGGLDGDERARMNRRFRVAMPKADKSLVAMWVMRQLELNPHAGRPLSPGRKNSA